MRRALLAFPVLFVLIAADNPLEGDKFLQKANEKFDQLATRAQDAYAKTMSEAYETKLKTYRSILAAATKAGNFDRARAVKLRIEQLKTELSEFAVGTPGKRPKIPKNAVKLGTHHYLLVTDPATWHVARRKCQEMGGHLATLETEEELRFIDSLNITASAWFGASDEIEEGRWIWLNGEKVAFPIVTSGGSDHFLLLVDGKNWEDGSAGSRLPFVCEWDH